VLAIIMTQLGFLGHEAAHRQIFKSGRWNDWTSLIIANLLVGISYGWWRSKHNKHHANPNKVGADPDVDLGAIAMTPEQATRPRSRLMKWLVSHQGWYFFPLLMLEGLSLRSEGLRRVVKRGPVERRWIEFTLLTVRIAGFVGLAFLVLSPAKAVAFIAVELAVFGFYMGSSFAPNHIGMPLVSPRLKLDAPSGPDESQHTRRTLHIDPHGRPQLPDRTPPLPLDGPPCPAKGATPRRRLLRGPSRAIYPNDAVAVLPRRHPLPQYRRSAGQGPVPVSTRCSTSRIVGVAAPPERRSRHGSDRTMVMICRCLSDRRPWLG
jgi:hypothetical protein